MIEVEVFFCIMLSTSVMYLEEKDSFLCRTTDFKEK